MPFKSTGSPDNTLVDSYLPSPFWCLLEGHTTTLETQQASKPHESLEVVCSLSSRHFHLFATKSRETVAQANGLALQVHLTIGAHDNTLNRYRKPHFPVEDIEVQGRTVTGLRLTRTRTQPLHPQGRSGHIEASWWGKIFLGLEYVYSSTTAVWVGCYAWCIGPCQPRTPGPGSPNGCPLGTSRDLWFTYIHLLQSPNCISFLEFLK